MSQIVFFGALVVLISVAYAVSALWERSRKLAVVLAILLVPGAAALYYYGGAHFSSGSKKAATADALAGNISELEEKVAKDPKDVRSMILLARSYMKVEKFELARDTYAKAVALVPGNPNLSVEYVGAVMRASSDQNFPPYAVKLLQQALVKDPNNQQALFFLGMHQMRTKQYAEAAATWGKMQPALEPSAAVELRLQVEVARLRAGLPPLPAAAMPIQIGIDPALASQIRKGDTLFIIARGLSEGGPPIAAKRIGINELPISVYLTDDDSPQPNSGLSAQFKVILQARLSHTGDVEEKPGDLESGPVEVATSSTGLSRLLIDRTVH